MHEHTLALAERIEAIEGEAYADLLLAAPSAWRCVAEETSCGWLLVAPPLDMLLFNRVIGCGLREPARASALKEQIDRFGECGVRNFGVQLAPLAQPAEIAEWLRGAGIVVRDRWTKLRRVRDVSLPTNSDVRVEEVRAGGASAFAEITTSGFGMPTQLRPWIASTVGRAGWRHYLAESDGVPIAAAALFVRRDVGWLGIASTLPNARRRGAQQALLARRVADALAMGCREVVTETAEELPERPNPSFRNVMRAGFDVVYQRPNFMLVR